MNKKFNELTESEKNTLFMEQSKRENGNFYNYIKQKGYSPYGKSETPQSGGFSGGETEQFKAYNGNTIPEEYKTPAQKQQFLSRLSEWQKQGNFTKTEKVDISTARSNLEQDPQFK